MSSEDSMFSERRRNKRFSNTKKKKRKRKEEAIYGVFGSDADTGDNDSDNNVYSSSDADADASDDSDINDNDIDRGKRKKKNNVRQPITFVKDNEIDKDDEDDSDKNNDADIYNKSNNSNENNNNNFATTIPNTSFGRSIQEGAQMRKNKMKQTHNSNSNDNGNNSNNDSMKNDVVLSRLKKTESSWHGKGIGLKLLTKMGFTGTIGKNSNNSNDNKNKDNKTNGGNIVTIMRPKAMGMGFNSFKEAGQVNNKSNNDSSNDNKKDTKIKEGEPLGQAWKKDFNNDSNNTNEKKKNNNIKARKEKNIYMSAELNNNNDDKNKDNKLVILDMTSKQGARLVTDLSQLNSNVNNDNEEEEFDAFPEMKHNLRLLVSQTEHLKLNVESELTRTRESIFLYTKLNAKLQKETEERVKYFHDVQNIAAEAKQVKSLQEEALLLLQKNSNDNSGNGNAENILEQMLQQIESIILSKIDAVEFRILNMPFFTFKIFLPLITRLTNTFSFDNVTNRETINASRYEFYTNFVKRVAYLVSLSSENYADPHSCDDNIGDDNKHYDHNSNNNTIDNPTLLRMLLQKSIVSKIRSFVVNSWDCSNPSPLIKIIREWTGVIPKDMFVDMYSTAVLPKLIRAVDTFKVNNYYHDKNHNGNDDFTRATKVLPLLHEWIDPRHPWLDGPWLSNKKENSINNNVEAFLSLQQQVIDLLSRIRRSLSLAIEENTVINWHPENTKFIETVILPWHPSKGALKTPTMSAVTSETEVSKEWKKLWGKEFHKMVQQSIMPKLLYLMSTELVINPAAQDLKTFSLVMRYYDEKGKESTAATIDTYGTSQENGEEVGKEEKVFDILSTEMVTKILNEAFFPQWLHVLETWLHANRDKNDDYGSLLEEVAAWYVGWKSLIPVSVQNEANIRVHLSRALNLMNDAANTALDIDSDMNEEGNNVKEEEEEEEGKEEQTKDEEMTKNGNNNAIHHNQQNSILDLISEYATSNNVNFAPKVPRRMHNNHIVYSFGKTSIIINNKEQTIKANISNNSNQGEWSDVFLEELLQLENEHKPKSKK